MSIAAIVAAVGGVGGIVILLRYFGQAVAAFVGAADASITRNDAEAESFNVDTIHELAKIAVGAAEELAAAKKKNGGEIMLGEAKMQEAIDTLMKLTDMDDPEYARVIIRSALVASDLGARIYYGGQ